MKGPQCFLIIEGGLCEVALLEQKICIKFFVNSQSGIAGHRVFKRLFSGCGLIERFQNPGFLQVDRSPKWSVLDGLSRMISRGF